MANELSIIPNPDNVPGAVTSGYQRQNTNLFVLQTGLDTTEPYDNGSGTITIPAGGIVECNGVLFKITANVSLTKGNANNAYWIAVNDNGNGFATLSPVSRPGEWKPDKKGCYLEDGRRTLNWVSLGAINNTTGLVRVCTRTAKGRETIMLPPGWYYIDLMSGKGGGAGFNGVGVTGGQGGTASGYKQLRVIIFSDGRQHYIKVGGSGGPGGKGGDGGSGGNGVHVGSITAWGGHGGGGGGGGCGGGEESCFDNFTTGSVRPGLGGNGANGEAGTGGNAGHKGGDGGGGGSGYAGNGAPGRTGGIINSSGLGGAAGLGAAHANLTTGGGSLAGSAGSNGGDGRYSTTPLIVSDGGGGGGGGGGGADGYMAEDGAPGGYCYINSIKN